ETLLKKLPDGTWVTLGYFYGGWKDNRPTGLKVEPFGAPEQLNGAAGNWERLFRPFKNVTTEQIEKDGLSTPLAGAIQQVLLKDNRKKFWPDQFTGSRTLIVVTDGEDNWGTMPALKLATSYKDKNGKPVEPGPLVLQSLLDTDAKDDVNLHIVFFGMS